MNCLVCGTFVPACSETGYQSEYCSRGCADVANEDEWTEEDADRHDVWLRQNGWYMEDMMKQIDLTFTKVKDTKNTVRFEEDKRDGVPTVVGPLYVQQWFIGDAQTVAVTITVGQ